MREAIAGPRLGILTGSWPLGMPADGGFYRDLAQQVEGLGYDLLFHGDHLFMYNPNPDALVVLSHMAACTRRVLLGTGVLLPALREPAVMAKQVATLDYLSGGRFVLGVGVGGEVEQEWAAMQVPRETRGARTDEYLELMQQLWSGEPVEHQGRFRSIAGVRGTPAPHRPGGPPIWVGGRGEASLRRATRHQGWFPYAMSPRRVREGVTALKAMMGTLPADYRIAYVLFAYVDEDEARAKAMAGRVLGKRYAQDFDKLLGPICAIGTPAHVAARVQEYRDAGAQDIIIVPQAPAEEYPQQIERLARVLGVRTP
jgi:probable F420-dependent oxidoreductase